MQQIQIRRPPRGRPRPLAALMALALSACIAAPVTNATAHSRAVPRCAEDEIIVGAGDYSRGYWERYLCVTADDYVTRHRFHRAIARHICDHPRHWERGHGIGTIVSEACDH